MKKEYKIENGRLICNGKAGFALGQSYYPSFHSAKYPVPPEGDRMGEMKKDLEQMAQMGFNHVRFAAIGSTALNEKGEVVVDTPFVDAMIEGRPNPIAAIEGARTVAVCRAVVKSCATGQMEKVVYPKI